MACRSSIQHARAAKHAADSTVSMAASSHWNAARHAHAEQEKLLARCPQVQSATARPFLMAFEFRPVHLETVRRCQLALSLLMALTQDVLLVPCMADVSWNVPSTRVMITSQLRLPLTPFHQYATLSYCCAETLRSSRVLTRTWWVCRVLKANNGSANLRVWPLDSITYTNRSASLSRICRVRCHTQMMCRPHGLLPCLGLQLQICATACSHNAECM